ncbi:hypothetical protein G3N95_12000 [Paraburkholderia sp. Tr-20389]|uniref:ATP-binding protein n=1 Tax=Paraburkholderia sp. Tr-20389 TaxID=2703903 RepID=UPI00197D0574|nr:ATP-binding protein [Paraburkholderia sp. Tr-20389]MBN3753664.1 hypothetical protein [Paraburkholderia sp. Tr-20389]
MSSIATGPSRTERPHHTPIREHVMAAFCHDVRQPLKAAMLRITSLRRSEPDGQRQEMFDELESNLDEIANMSETVLDALRVTGTAATPAASVIEVGDLLARVCGDFSSVADRRGLRLRARPSPYVIVSDAALIRRILSNLVMNALQYTRTGGVMVAARRIGRDLSIEVWDTGPGILHAELEDIFSLYRRGDRDCGTGSYDSHCGIGLWSGREFARLLGGTLTAASRSGRGSVFRLRLPADAIRLTRATPRLRRFRARVALLGPDAGSMLPLVHDIHAAALVAFSDPLQLLEALGDRSSRPHIVLIDIGTGEAEVDLLVKFLRARCQELCVGILAGNAIDCTASVVAKLGVPVWSKPLSLAHLRDLCETVALRKPVRTRP